MRPECGGDARVEGGNDSQEDEILTPVSINRCHSIPCSFDFRLFQELVVEFDDVVYFGRKESPTVASICEGSAARNLTEEWTSEQNVR
jgi:hypothetical protein